MREYGCPFYGVKGILAPRTEWCNNSSSCRSGLVLPPNWQTPVVPRMLQSLAQGYCYYYSSVHKGPASDESPMTTSSIHTTTRCRYVILSPLYEQLNIPAPNPGSATTNDVMTPYSFSLTPFRSGNNYHGFRLRSYPIPLRHQTIQSRVVRMNEVTQELLGRNARLACITLLSVLIRQFI